MNFEVFKTIKELEERIVDLTGIAKNIIWENKGGVFTLKWTRQ